jgi:hypothetical protein
MPHTQMNVPTVPSRWSMNRRRVVVAAVALALCALVALASSDHASAATRGPVTLAPGAQVVLEVGPEKRICTRNLQFATGRVKTQNTRFYYLYDVAPFATLCVPANELGLSTVLVSNVGITFLEVTSRIFA